MGKSLREALAEQMSTLREQGLAPEVMPDGEELESGIHVNGENGHVADDRAPDGHRKLGKRAMAKRVRTPTERPRMVNARERIRPDRSKSEAPSPTAVARPPSIGKLLQRRADDRRREQDLREEIIQRLSQLSERQMDEESTGVFMRKLERETGVLPPLHVVLEALKNSSSAGPEAVAHQVRVYYRQSRAHGPRAANSQP